MQQYVLRDDLYKILVRHGAIATGFMTLFALQGPEDKTIKHLIRLTNLSFREYVSIHEIRAGISDQNALQILYNPNVSVAISRQAGLILYDLAALFHTPVMTRRCER